MSDLSDQTNSRQVGVITALLKRLGLGREDANLRQSLEDVIEEHDHALASSSIGADELAMLSNILRHGDLRIEEVMVPRVDVVALDDQITFAEALDTFIQAGHSRLPVYQGSLDHVVGMVHVKDALRTYRQNEGSASGLDFRELQRPVMFVAPSMRVMDLLAKMRAKRMHMAIVVDEYGGTDGLITIEDLVEQVVGEIEDEHDRTEPEMIRVLSNGNLDLDARLLIEELEARLGDTLIDEERDEDVETVGGLVFTLAGSIPQIGERIEHPKGYCFEVVNADPRRILKLRMYRPDQPEDA